MRKHRHWLMTLVLGAVLAVPVACDDDATGVQVGDLAGTWTLTRASDCEFDTGTGNWGTLTIQSNGTFTFATIDEDFDFPESVVLLQTRPEVIAQQKKPADKVVDLMLTRFIKR